MKGFRYKVGDIVYTSNYHWKVLSMTETHMRTKIIVSGRDIHLDEEEDYTIKGFHGDSEGDDFERTLRERRQRIIDQL